MIQQCYYERLWSMPAKQRLRCHNSNLCRFNRLCRVCKYGLQGNCSDSDPVAALGLSVEVYSNLLPLKPRQCLLVVSKTWLMVNSGQIWIDNLYLKLSRRQVEPSFAFVTIGSPSRFTDVTFNSTVGQSDTYLTGITFHGEHRGNARGVNCDVLLASFLVDGTVRNEECNLRPVLVS